MTAYALSNPANLARILSLGVIGPRAMYDDKYRNDGTELAGGRLWLSSEPPTTADIARAAVDEPILLELDHDLEGEGTRALDSVLPRNCIVRAIFPSDKACKDFVTTPFANVDPTSVDSEVDAAAFASSRGTEGDEQPTLLDVEGADSPVGSAMTIERVRTCDRLMGGALEALQPVAPSEGSVGLGLELLRATISGGRPSEVLAAAVGADAARISGIGALLMEREVGASDNRRALDEAQSRELIDDATHARLVKVLKGRADLGGPSEWDDPVGGALVVALIANEPGTVRDRFRDEVEHATTTLALWFAGLLRGAARRPVDERVNGLEKIVQASLAAMINDHASEALAVTLPDASMKIGADAFEFVLDMDEVVVVARRPFPSLRQRLVHAARDEAREPAVRASLARGLGVSASLTVELGGDELGRLRRDGDRVWLIVDQVTEWSFVVDTDRLVSAIEAAPESDLSALESFASSVEAMT